MLRAMTAIALVVALGAAACGSSTESTQTAGPLPFDAVLLELFDTTDTDAYLATTARTAAELIVTCMEDAGFQFAIPPAAPIDTADDRESLDYARREGFGVITGFLRSLEGADFTSDPSDPSADANLTYLRTLSVADVNRFLITLNGAPAEPGQLQDGGCNVGASGEAYADWERFVTAVPSYTTLGEERDSHPDWLGTRAIWRECMVGRGYDYAEPDVIMSDVTNRMRAIVEARYPGGDLPLVESAGELVLDPEVHQLLDEMADFERAAAVANVECTTPIADRFEAVDRLVQQDFVDRNRVAIDELLAATRETSPDGN